MYKTLMLALVFLILQTSQAFAGIAVPNWQSWSAYPDVQRMTAEQVQELLVSGEKMVLIYAGYKSKKIVCGSMYLPYTSVPPKASGAGVNLKIPKDTWMVCYCP